MKVIDLYDPKTEEDWEAKKAEILMRFSNPAIPLEEKVMRLAKSLAELTHWNFKNGEDIIKVFQTMESLDAIQRKQSEIIMMLIEEAKKTGTLENVVGALRTFFSGAAVALYLQLGSAIGVLSYYRDKLFGGQE